MRTMSALGAGNRQGLQAGVERFRGPPIPRSETEENGVRHQRQEGGRMGVQQAANCRRLSTTTCQTYPAYPDLQICPYGRYASLRMP